MTRRNNRYRSRNSNIRYNRSAGRDHLTPIARPLPQRSEIIQNFDNRYFSFPVSSLPRHPVTRYGSRASIHTTVKKGRSLYAQFKITAPRKTLVCIRRKTRKEVIFALGIGGKRLRTRKVRRNANSAFRC